MQAFSRSSRWNRACNQMFAAGAELVVGAHESSMGCRACGHAYAPCSQCHATLPTSRLLEPPLSPALSGNAVPPPPCSQCHATLPTSRLLELHVSEAHDSFFAAQAARRLPVGSAWGCVSGIRAASWATNCISRERVRVHGLLCLSMLM